MTLPFLTAFDPPGTSEGTLDPLGLYQIADQLATKLVPAVRERMQRIRFLTVMAIGSLVTESIDTDQSDPVPPFLVWEWLVVEALIRTLGDDGVLWGLPGSQVTRRAVANHGYVDLRSYLKTPRIFGFHGVYKRLAAHVGVVNTHLGLGQETERVVDAWARDAGFGGLEGWGPLRKKWQEAVVRSLGRKPVRTAPNWAGDDWAELANLVAPRESGTRERRCLREMLHAAGDRSLGALPQIWALQEGFDEDYREEDLHIRLKQTAPQYGPHLVAIRRYEAFCRSMQDAFDLLLAQAGGSKLDGVDILPIASDNEFCQSIAGLNDRFAQARHALGEIDLRLQNLFDQRFGAFAELNPPSECAIRLCRHHEVVQKSKSDAGKRAWFDRVGEHRIYVRQAYRVPRRDPLPGKYVHDYRAAPIRRFYEDLT